MPKHLAETEGLNQETERQPGIDFHLVFELGLFPGIDT